MAMNWARGGVFAAGVVLGAIGSAALFGPGGDDPRFAGASPPAMPAPVPAVAPGAADCASYKPVVAAAGEGDGQLALAQDVPASSSTVHEHLVQGKEEAAAGRARDAEAAFLMACRGAARLADDPVPLADAQYQLGRHYAQLAAAPQAARRDELVQRAQALYVTALATFRQHRGPGHEKTRFAAEGLARLQQRTAGAAAATAAPAPSAKAEAEADREQAAAKEAEAKEAAAKEAAAKEAAAKEAAAKEAAAKEAAAKEAAAKKAAAKAAATKEAAAKEAAAKEAAAKEAAAKEAAAKEAAAKEAAAKEAAAKEAAARQAAAREAAAREAAANQAAAARARQQEPARTAAAEPAARTRRTEPSFDCDRARSTSERLICGDEDLARQDRELGRLYERAKEAAPDARAFQRQSDAAWQRREDTCRDRECLQRWYAQRRAELSAAAQVGAPAPTSALGAGAATGDTGLDGAIPQAEGSADAD